MNVLELFKPIKTFVFDVDGVMTDGTLQLLENGELSRKMHIRDGYALQLAVKQGYRVVIISGGSSRLVVERLKGLGLTDIYMGVHDKESQLEAYLEENGLRVEELLYMGDDIPDYGAMKKVGLPTCPRDAAREIKAICKYISPISGGCGCVRDVIEKVLLLNGDWKEES